MSKLNQIISRVVIDDAFRAEFLSNPVKAAESYNLSESEIAELKSVDFSELSSINNELEERLSKSFVSIPGFCGDEDMVHNNVHTSHANDAGGGW